MVHLHQSLLLLLLVLLLLLLLMLPQPPVSRRSLPGDCRSLSGEPVFDPLGLQRPMRARPRQRIHGLERSDYPSPSDFWCSVYPYAHSTADVWQQRARTLSALVLCGLCVPGGPLNSRLTSTFRGPRVKTRRNIKMRRDYRNW